MPVTATDHAAMARAIDAEPDLAAVDAVVDTLCARVRPEDRLCAGCAWENIVKPLASPLIGWERGVPRPDALDADANLADQLRARMTTGDKFIFGNRPPEPTTDTERWLRSSEAWDAVTKVWLARLDAADPGNDHGTGRREA